MCACTRWRLCRSALFPERGSGNREGAAGAASERRRERGSGNGAREKTNAAPNTCRLAGLTLRGAGRRAAARPCRPPARSPSDSCPRLTTAADACRPCLPDYRGHGTRSTRSKPGGAIALPITQTVARRIRGLTTPYARDRRSLGRGRRIGEDVVLIPADKDVGLSVRACYVGLCGSAHARQHTCREQDAACRARGSLHVGEACAGCCMLHGARCIMHAARCIIHVARCMAHVV